MKRSQHPADSIGILTSNGAPLKVFLLGHAIFSLLPSNEILCGWQLRGPMRFC
jgi:hypothetical protein